MTEQIQTIEEARELRTKVLNFEKQKLLELKSYLDQEDNLFSEASLYLEEFKGISTETDNFLSASLYGYRMLKSNINSRIATLDSELNPTTPVGPMA